MKTLFNRLALILALTLGSTAAMQAQQATTVEYGRSALVFDSSFTSAIASLGAQLGGVGFSSIDTSGTVVFPVVSGALDLQTGQGEVNTLGGLSVNANGLQLRLQNFVVDTTGSPVLTALLIVNNKLVGRIPLFSLTLPAGTSLPLSTTVGVLQLNGYNVTFNPTGANIINSIFGNHAIPGGMQVGSFYLYAVLSPNSAS